MRLKRILRLSLVLTLLPMFISLAHAADAERGAMLYESRCGACHSIDQNRIGPRHLGVFGRKAGTQDDYDYSEALAASAILWDETTLDRWLANPQALVPGQKMGYRLRKAEDRADIIAFFKSLTRQIDGSALKLGRDAGAGLGGS